MFNCHAFPVFVSGSEYSNSKSQSLDGIESMICDLKNTEPCLIAWKMLNWIYPLRKLIPFDEYRDGIEKRGEKIQIKISFDPRTDTFLDLEAVFSDYQGQKKPSLRILFRIESLGEP